MTTTPIHNLTDTWNSGGTTFNAIKMNVTDNSSDDASKLFLLQVGGTDVSAIDKSGYFPDNLFGVSSNSTRTDRVRFDAANATGSITLILPDADTDTLAAIAKAQTFTNKSVDLANNTLTGTTAEFNTALSDDSFATLTNSVTLTNKTLTSPILNGTLSGDAFLDEDTMASDSATKLASQQSIKAYADNGFIPIGHNYFSGMYAAGNDLIELQDAAITASGTTLTSASNPFVAGDVGKEVVIRGAGASNAFLATTIASYTGAGEVEVTAAAGTTVSNAEAVFGTNDTTAIQNAINAISTAGGGTLNLSRYHLCYGLDLPANVTINGLSNANYIRCMESGNTAGILISGSGAGLTNVRLKGPFPSQPTRADLDSGSQPALFNHGVEIKKTLTTRIRDVKGHNCYVSGFGYANIWLEHLTDSQFTQMKSERAGKYGVAMLSNDDVHWAGLTVLDVGPGQSGNSPYYNMYGITMTRDSSTNTDTNPPTRRCSVNGAYFEDIPTWTAIDIHGAEDCVVDGWVARNAANAIGLTDGTKSSPSAAADYDVGKRHRVSDGIAVRYDDEGSLVYNQPSAGFTVGETVTGGTSSATGVVVSDNALNRVRLKAISGTFQAAETITGGTSSSTANVVAVNTTLRLHGINLSGTNSAYPADDVAFSNLTLDGYGGENSNSSGLGAISYRSCRNARFEDITTRNSKHTTILCNASGGDAYFDGCDFGEVEGSQETAGSTYANAHLKVTAAGSRARFGANRFDMSNLGTILADIVTPTEGLEHELNHQDQSFYYGSLCRLVDGDPALAIASNFDVQSANSVDVTIESTKSAVAAGTWDTGTSATFPAGKWGVALLSTDGATPTRVVTWATNSGSGYDSEDDAIAMCPVTPDDEAAVGMVTVQAHAGNSFTAGTDALTGGTGGNVAQTTNYYDDDKMYVATRFFGVTDGQAGMAKTDLARTGYGFDAYLSATASNVLGATTSYYVVCDTARFNEANCYNTSTGIFTAQADGLHRIYGTLSLGGITSSEVDLELWLEINGSLYSCARMNPDTIISSISSTFLFPINFTVNLEKGQTVRLRPSMQGGSDVVDVTGQSTGISDCTRLGVEYIRPVVV